MRKVFKEILKQIAKMTKKEMFEYVEVGLICNKCKNKIFVRVPLFKTGKIKNKLPEDKK